MRIKDNRDKATEKEGRDEQVELDISLVMPGSLLNI